MNEYLLGGLAVALLVLLLLWVARALRRRPVVRRPRGERDPGDVVPSPTRSGDELDTISAVHALPAARTVPGATLQRRAEQEAEEAELAARAEADREAAEWEAQLLAQQLAQEEHERSRVAAESAAASDLDLLDATDTAIDTAPDTVSAAESEPSTQPPSAFDEQAVLEALAREAAEWEARLAAQQLADAERQAAEEAEAAAQAQRVAEEQAAQARAEQLAAQRAQQLEAERQAQEAAAARALAEQQAQAEAAARQAAAALPQAPDVVEAPVAPVAAAVAPSGAAVPPVEPVSRTPEQCRVMVADDSKVVRVKTSRLLAKHAYQVALAEDGLDALRQIADAPPDVLITDVEMPHMDGFALTRQLRNDPRTAHIPIVMITADDQKHRAEALDAGVSVLLSKPYPEDELLSYLQSTMAGLVPAH